VAGSHELADAHKGRLGRDAVKGGDHIEVFQASQGFEDGAGFRDKINVTLDLKRWGQGIESADGGDARSGLDHTSQHFERGAFAVTSKKTDHLDRRNLERQLILGQLQAELLGQALEPDHSRNCYAAARR
jgi:hypothetical protein